MEPRTRFRLLEKYMIQLELSKVGVFLRLFPRIFAISLALFFAVYVTASQTYAATLYSAAANQDIYEGQTFVVDWFLDTEGRPINTVDLNLDFSPQTLEVVDANAGNSLINLWIKYPTADNNAGKIELLGGVPNGANDSKIPIFRATFKAKATGTAFVNLNSASAVLLNDGLGSREQLKFKNLLFNVYPKDFIPIKISSATHPDQNRWYRNSDVVIKFESKPDEDYSFSFSSNIDNIPDEQKDEVPKEIKYASMPDGLYYFKLNSKTGPSDWKEAAVYRVQIDQTPPEDFTPTVGSDPAVFDGESFLSFSTLDKMSGISHYKLKVGLFDQSHETQSPYKLSKPWVGDLAVVSAIDRAGNKRVENVVWEGYLSVKEFELILILIGLIGLFFNPIVRKQIIKHK